MKWWWNEKKEEKLSDKIVDTEYFYVSDKYARFAPQGVSGPQGQSGYQGISIADYKRYLIQQELIEKNRIRKEKLKKLENLGNESAL